MTDCRVSRRRRHGPSRAAVIALAARRGANVSGLSGNLSCVQRRSHSHQSDTSYQRSTQLLKQLARYFVRRRRRRRLRWRLIPLTEATARSSCVRASVCPSVRLSGIDLAPLNILAVRSRHLCLRPGPVVPRSTHGTKSRLLRRRNIPTTRSLIIDVTSESKAKARV